MPFPAYGTARGTIEYAKSAREINHDVAMVMSIVSAFVPVIGPALSAGWMAMDAYQYHKEGDDQMAGLMAIFAALPGIGSLAKLAAGPILAKMGVASRKILARKIIAHQAGKKVTFTKAEQAVLNDIAGNPKLIQREMQKEIAKQTGKKSLAKQVGKVVTRGGVDLAKFTAITVAWNQLYAEMNIDVANMESKLQPILKKIKKAVESESNSELAKTATPGMNTGVFSRLPKLEQIIREEYLILKEGLGDATTENPKPSTTDYSKVKVPFVSTIDLQNFRDYFAKRSQQEPKYAKDYNRLKSKMRGADVTTADQEFYSLHKKAVDLWWSKKQKQKTEEQEESWWPDMSTIAKWAIWSSVLETIFEFLKSAGGAITGIAGIVTSLAFWRMSKQKNVPAIANVAEAQKLRWFYRIIPKITRSQLKKLMKSLGKETSALTDESLDKLVNKIRQTQPLMRAELEKQVILNRLNASRMFLNNPSEGSYKILFSWLTDSEKKAYGQYIDKFLELSEKRGNAGWATRWFR